MFLITLVKCRIWYVNIKKFFQQMSTWNVILIKFYLKNKLGLVKWIYLQYMKHFLHIIIIRASEISRCVKTEGLLCFIWWLAVLLWPKALWKLLKTCYFHLGWFSSSFFCEWMTRPWVWRGSRTSWFEMYAIIASWFMKIDQLYTTWATPF